MKLKIPPPIVTFVFSGMMYLLAKFLPIGYFDFFGRIYLIYTLIISAMIVMIVSLSQFFISKTTTNPLNPSKASKLVVNGIYQYTRNPMYLSMLLMLLALGVWLGNAFNTLIAAAFVAYMNKFQIFPEERALTKIFDKEYKQYCTLVRRWF